MLRWFEGTLGWQLSRGVAPDAGANLGAEGLLTGGVTRGAVADGNGAVVGVSSCDSVSRMRNMTGKPHLLRVLSVDVATDDALEGGDASSAATTLTNTDLFRLSFGNSATVTPRLGGPLPRSP